MENMRLNKRISDPYYKRIQGSSEEAKELAPQCGTNVFKANMK